MPISVNDYILVHRPGNNQDYSVLADNIMDKVRTGDQLLINRDGVDYVVTGQELFDYIKS
jgi:hypothetical protein